MCSKKASECGEWGASPFTYCGRALEESTGDLAVDYGARRNSATHRWPSRSSTLATRCQAQEAMACDSRTCSQLSGLALGVKTFRLALKTCRSKRLSAGPLAALPSHPTVGVHQTFLSPSHLELNISPDTKIGIFRFAPPDQHFNAPVLTQYTSIGFILTAGSSRRELNRSEAFGPKRGTPTVG